MDSLCDAARNPRTYMRQSGLHPRIHSKNLDRTFGYKIPKIEQKLTQKYRSYYQGPDESNKKKHYFGTQTWIGLHPQALQTTYNDIFEALYIIQEHNIDKVVDIGAGYGRVGLVMSSLFPEARFIGFEILKQRQQEGNRVFEKLKLVNCEILLENVLEEKFILPQAQVYFIYDFSEAEDICKILDELVSRIEEYNFFLITKGDLVDYLLEKKYKQFWQTNGYLSSGEIKIYSSNTDLKAMKN